MGSRLQNKVVIITGGSRGIGKACAIRCGQAGAKVVVNYVANEAAARRTVDEIKAMGGQAISVQADVSNKKDVKRLVGETIKAFGKVTGLINNAGVAPFVDFMEMEEETWDSTMAINAKGPYLTTQAVAREMIKAGNGGRICNITSISGVKATNELQVPYCTSKGAANMFTKVAALALAKYKITVNAILPGTIETDINREVLNQQGVRQGIIDATPLRCLGDVDDIAYATVYFMSDESKWVTGSLLVIDGGFIA
jgi:NAD(P)-dependent dehydrogenase (short-subunit alcohol dehydrogenase family)